MLMKQQIENKINEIIENIIKKPANEITMDDYTILSSELRDIRFRESQEDSRSRMAELLAMANNSVAGFGSVR